MIKNRTITVFGATGKIGSELLPLLSEAHWPVIAITRDLSKSKKMAHVEWLQADMSDSKSLQKTIPSGGSVFLLSSHSQNFVAEQSNVIQTAVANGAGHIVKLSSGAADKNSALLIPRIHGEAEDHLRRSGVPFTILRPNAFMQNWLGELAESVKKERKIYEATGDGKRAYVDLRDIAAVACRILTDPAAHNKQTHMLTGGEALNFGQIADLMGDILQESVRFIALSIEQARQRMKEKGLPPSAIDTLISYVQEQRNGNTAATSGDIQKILGKQPRTAREFFKDHVELFK